MKTFETSTYLSQVRQLRKIAHIALANYPIKVKQVQFIQHQENATYKVIAAEGVFLLRIHRKNYHSKAAILEELKWLNRLSKQTENIQKPVPSKNNLLVEEITDHTTAITRYCSLFTWQDGEIRYKSLQQKNMYAAGLLAAQLHKNAAKIKVKHREYWTLEGLLSEDAKFGSYKSLQAELSKSQYAIVDKCRKMAFKKINPYRLKYPEKSSLIHADLHFGNIVWAKNQPIPIDFDDCGFGFHMYDIAVTLGNANSLFKGPKTKLKKLYVESLLEGYASVKNLTTADIDILPYFLLTRNLSMFLWLYDRKNNNPSMVEYFKKGKHKKISYYKKVLNEGPTPLY